MQKLQNEYPHEISTWRNLRVPSFAWAFDPQPSVLQRRIGTSPISLLLAGCKTANQILNSRHARPPPDRKTYKNRLQTYLILGCAQQSTNCGTGDPHLLLSPDSANFIAIQVSAAIPEQPACVTVHVLLFE